MNRLPLFRKNKFLTVPAVAVSIGCAICLAGCAGSNPPDMAEDMPAGTMLVDCYRGVRAESATTYTEMVLYTTEDRKVLKLCVYVKTDEDDEEICTEYLAPYRAVQKCYSVIEQYGVQRWNDMEDYISADGVLDVCRYYDNGSYIRVSSEQMATDGEKFFDSLSAAMTEYIPAG
ncbi:MAG: hypothetical protein IJD80_06570 [Oscillospiraceae bacterium]|nr:hypothetical protein [Oscillospiraceae bacterium]